MHNVRVIDPRRDLQWDNEFLEAPRIGEELLIPIEGRLFLAPVERVVHESSSPGVRVTRVYIGATKPWA